MATPLDQSPRGHLPRPGRAAAAPAAARSAVAAPAAREVAAAGVAS